MAKNTYSCLHKPIKINRNKMYILLLLGQLCVGRVAFGVTHNLTTGGNYATTADVSDGLELSGTGNQADINNKLSNPGSDVLTSTEAALSTTINIGANGSIVFSNNTDGISLTNLSNASAGLMINNLGEIKGDTANPTNATAINAFRSEAPLTIDNRNKILGKILFGDAGDTLNQNFGEIKGDITSDAGNDVITIKDGKITGSINTETGNDTINFDGGTITGNIEGNAGDDTINFNGGTLEGNFTGGAGKDTINYNSGNITGTIDGGSDDNTFNINGDFTTQGNISNIQTINNSKGKFTINHAVSSLNTGLNIQAGAEVKVASAGSIARDAAAATNNSIININKDGKMYIMPGANKINVTTINNNGYLNLGDNDVGTVSTDVNITGNLNNNDSSAFYVFDPVNITGDYTIKAKSTHTMFVKTNGTANTLTATNVNFEPGSRIIINHLGALPNTGDTVTIAIATGAVSNSADIPKVEVTSDTALIKYAPPSVDLTKNVKATATKRTYDAVLTELLTDYTPNTYEISKVLQRMSANRANLSAELQTLLNKLDRSAINVFGDNLDQVIPDLSVTRAADLSMQSSSMVLEQINTRIAQVSNLNSAKFAGLNQEASGYAAGDYATKQHYWIKAFGLSSKQKALTESNGYNANLAGFALGLDKSVNSKLLLGASLSYSSTKVKSKDLNPDKSRIQSPQFTLYANYSQPQYYVNAYLGAGLNRYRTDRTVNGANNHAKFNGIQPTVRMDVGMPKVINNVNITPNASLQYNHLRQQKYNETGNALALKNVDAKNTHLLRGGLGAKWEIATVNANNCVIPEFRMMGWYDFINTQPQITTEFAGGGGMFPLKGDKANKFTFNLGASLNYVKTGGFSVSFNYDLYAKKKFIGHSGSLLAKFSI